MFFSDYRYLLESFSLMETKLVDLAINHMYFKKSVTFVTISSIDGFINMNTFKVNESGRNTCIIEK